jgi:hypothetical protein
LIIEAVVATGNEPSLAKDFDTVMLMIPGGIERTEEKYRVLLERAGFRLSSVTPTAIRKTPFRHELASLTHPTEPITPGAVYAFRANLELD